MVHVRVRHEHLRDLDQCGRRLAVDTSEIEKDGAPLMAQAHVEAGVAKWRIDEARDEGGAHDDAGAYRVSECGTSRLLAPAKSAVRTERPPAIDWTLTEPSASFESHA